MERGPEVELFIQSPRSMRLKPVVGPNSDVVIEIYSGDDSKPLRRIRLPSFPPPTILAAPFKGTDPKTNESVTVWRLSQTPPVEVLGEVKDRRGESVKDDRVLGVDSRISEAGNTYPPELSQLLGMAVQLGYHLSEQARRIPVLTHIWCQALLGLAQPTTEGVKEPQTA